jgi:hypothetical protein
MKRIMLIGCMVAGLCGVTGGAQADVGVGACVVGNGFSFGAAGTPDAYAGVNVGQNSETGVYDNQVDYETQCCAETGQEPDCFKPVN